MQKCDQKQKSLEREQKEKEGEIDELFDSIKNALNQRHKQLKSQLNEKLSAQREQIQSASDRLKEQYESINDELQQNSSGKQRKSKKRDIVSTYFDDNTQTELVPKIHPIKVDLDLNLILKVCTPSVLITF